VYASIRQAKAKAGMAEELTRRVKEGPFRSSVMSKASFGLSYRLSTDHSSRTLYSFLR
jgi:hypothetical protein